MRWSCPHCGINLAVQDDKLGNGWTFSRCYKCGGYALIRKADVNLIKVNGAPNGERVLLPEPNEQPVLSQQAATQYSRYVQPASASTQAAAPVISPPTAEAPPLSPPPAPRNLAQGFPEPLPEVPSTTRNFTIPKVAQWAFRAGARDFSQKLLPVAIGLAGVSAIGSGIYFYLQGQALLQKAQGITTNNARTVSANVLEAYPSQPASTAPAAPAVVRASAPAAAEARPRNLPISDQVRQVAMAPLREAQLEDSEGSPLFVKIVAPNAKIRSGPSLRYPIISIANPRYRYIVTNWNERWFKIEVKDPTVKQPQMVGQAARQHITGWIRNDLVQLVPGYRTTD